MYIFASIKVLANYCFVGVFFLGGGQGMSATLQNIFIFSSLMKRNVFYFFFLP